VAGLFSSFTAADPQLVVDIDRDKARALGLPLREVNDALQVLLGSSYVNDFDFNNRAYRVYVQADQQFRASAGRSQAVLRTGVQRADGAARHGGAGS
jgi:HAE1 family hydrophobic/amphiphilic exporter-1